MGKKKLREKFRSLRQGLSSEEVADKSLEICRAVSNLQVWKEAASVLLYMAHENEVDPRFLLDMAWDREIKTYLPRCRADAPGCMDLVRVRGGHELQKGMYGITEPAPELCADENCFPDAAIVPGLAFGFDGYRLGRGGGYYDRFIDRLRAAKSKSVCIGLAYRFQLVETAPRDEWDRPVDAIATEEGIFWV